MKNKIVLFLTGLLTLPGAVLANSTVKMYDGLYWYNVPANALGFHVDFPWDFLFYIFAIIGWTYVAYDVYRASLGTTWLRGNCYMVILALMVCSLALIHPIAMFMGILYVVVMFVAFRYDTTCDDS